MKKLIILFLALGSLSTLVACNSIKTKNDIVDTSINEVQEENKKVEENIVEVAEKNLVVKPLENSLDLEQLEDCTMAISFDKESIKVDESSTATLDATVYVYDLYDMVDISMLKEGDTIVRAGNDVLVSSIQIKDNGFVLINGGIDNGGFDLRTDDGTVYYEIGYSDLKSYYELGKVYLPISPDFVYEDTFNLDNDAITMNIEEFIDLEKNVEYSFNPNNTTIRVENGFVVEMTRVYTP